MLENIGLFRGIMAKMNWLDQNQRLISENVANSDTPGFRPSNLKSQDFEAFMGRSASPSQGRASKISMAETDDGHINPSGKPGMPSQARAKVLYEASPDDNGVVLEEQLFKANENATNYQLATNLYRRNVGMLRMVIQGVRG